MHGAVTRDTGFYLPAERLAALGAERASPQDVSHVHNLAMQLLGDGIASPSMLAAMQAHNEDTVFVVRRPERPEDLQGSGDDAAQAVKAFLALLPLTDAGIEALWADHFDPIDVKYNWVSALTKQTKGVYVWGVGGSDRLSRRDIWGLARHLERDVFGDLPHFARPATPRGQTLMRQHGYTPLAALRPGAPQRFWMRPPLARERATMQIAH